MPSYPPHEPSPIPCFRNNSGQHFTSLLPLFRRTVTIAVKSPVLSFFNRLLAIAAAVKSPKAIGAPAHLEGPILDELFPAFSALNCHADILLHSSTYPPL